MRAISVFFVLIGSLGSVGSISACDTDPVLSTEVEKLGPESSEGPSAYHRAGEPCATCHQLGGSADTDFSMAGTVFAAPGDRVGVGGVSVELVDSAGTSPPRTDR